MVRLRSALMSNLGLKLLAILVAVVVWFYFLAAREGISLGAYPKRSVTLPVKVLAAVGRVIDVRVEPGEVSVTFSGAKSEVEAIDQSRAHAYIDVSGLGKGSYTMPVRVEVEGEVKVLGTQPAMVEVRVTR